MGRVIDKFGIWIILFLALLTRLFVFNPHSAFFFPDEEWYAVLQSSLSNSYLQALFQINGRPGFGILYLPALVFENATAGLLLNIFFNTSLIILIYLITTKVLNRRIAFFVSLVAVFSIPLLMYTRHLLPYDSALFLALLGFYIWLSKKSHLLFGLLLGLSFIVYPSHFYYFLPIPLFLVILNLFQDHRIISSHSLLAMTKQIALFFIGIAIPLLIMQLFSLGTIPTYFQSLTSLSESVTQGDYVSVFIFFKDYILAIDGIARFLFASAALGVLALQYKNKPFTITGIYLIAVVIILELFSHILQSTVLYGRTTRPLYVLLILAGSAALFQLIEKSKFNKNYSISFLVILLVVVNWFPHYLNYKHITYQEDFVQLAQEFPVQLTGVWDYRQNENDSSESLYPFQKGIVYMENRDIVYPFYGMKTIHCTKEVLFEKPHALTTFKPYVLEGFNRNMRSIMEHNPPRHEVFRCG